jgi:Family of unknown function (DUF6510)
MTDRLGAFMAYKHNMGMVVRCRACDTPLIRLTHMKGRYWMDMRGMLVLQISESR